MESLQMLTHSYSGPNEQFLIAIKSDNLFIFKQQLENAPYDFNNEFFKPNTGTLLDICCKLPNKHAFVEELLSAGVDVNYLNGAGKAGIHYAAESGNKDTLRVLIQYPLTDINILDTDKNSALYLATKNRHVECAQLLLESKKIEPNRVNAEGKNSAYIAATSEEKHDDLMRLFIKCPNVDLDTIVQEKTLRESITDNYPHFMEKKYENPINYLKSKDIEGFIWYVSFTRRLEHDDGKNEEHTYLQYACDVGLTEVVKVLLEFGADPNKIIQENDNYPVFIASLNGFAEIIRLFLDSDKYIIYHSTKGNVIHELLNGWSKNPNKSDVNNDLCNYEMSFNMLLEQCKYDLYKTPKININWVGDDGYTCLHLALKSGQKKIIFGLLDHNAYLGKMNKSRNPLLTEISPDLLESYLDSCITSTKKSPNIIDHDINLSYNFLCPPMVFTPDDIIYDQMHMESQKNAVVLENIKETDPLLYMSEVPALEPLLVHPVISCFVFLKWHRIKLFYYLNFAVYLGFLSILTLFILFHSYSENVLWKTYGYGWSVVLLGLIAVCFRELFQMISSPIKYIMDFQNWMELLMISLTITLLFENLDDGIRIQVSAIVILVSWGQILFFIGRHPIQAINLEILKVVTVNFFKFLIWFSIIIVAFILCFYMLFHYNKDNTIWDIIIQISLMSFETILMLTGEFNITDTQFSSYPIVSRLLFILFIFIINIVLINLLSGLAVSDIQQIKNVSKIIAMKSNIRFVQEFETVLNENNLISYIFFLSVKFKLCSKLELFPDALEKPNVTIKSNQNFQNKVVNAVLSGIYLDDEDIIKATSICNLNLQKSKENYMDIFETFNSIEKSMADFKEMLRAAMNRK